MLETILDEQKIIDDALNNKIIDDKPTKTLKVLVKYYYLQGMDERYKLKEQLLYFMKENYKGFKRSQWEKSVNNIVDGFLRNIRRYGKTVELTDIKSISITQNEFNKIKEIQTVEGLKDLDDLVKKNLEKICFVMLVYAKIANKQLKNKESWINKTCATILKEAKVNLTGDEKKRIFNHLYKSEYILQSNATEKTSMKINYVDVDEISDIICTIDNFEGIIYYFLNLNGENWKICEGENCNKWIKVTTGNNKYCSVCARDVKLNKDKTRMKNIRNMQIVES